MKNFIPHYIQTPFLNNIHKGSFKAFTMFVDLSGFTPLTETLMKEGNEGAEQLSISLNNIFAPMVNLVYSQRGFIPYFAGDAFTAIFPIDEAGNDANHLINTAQTLLSTFNPKEATNTRFGDFEIGIKTGLSYGTVDWGIVGNTFKSFYFRGSAIDNCALAQGQANEQEIILDQHLMDQVDNAAFQLEAFGDQYYRLLDRKTPAIASSVLNKTTPLQKDVVYSFLPDSVINVNEIGEFRNVVSLFISFDGVEDHDSFNQFMTEVLNQINSFSGYLKEIDFGDKGGVIVGFFGAPVSFENNIERALEFVLSLKEELQAQKQPTLRFRIGLTSGLAYTGIVGGEERCQYAAVGNRINLAARLMSKAQWGEILVDEEVQKNKLFEFKNKGKINYKGIEGDIPTFALTRRNIDNKPVFSGELIGRDEELEQLFEFAHPFFRNRFPGVAFIYGEAGIGKSRLCYELNKRFLNRQSITWFTCQADQILRKPFNPFIYFLKNYFKQSPENSRKENHAFFEEHFERLVKASETITSNETETIVSELKRTKSILAALIGIFYPDSLWEKLDAKGRYQNTFAALSNLFIAQSLIQPLTIELEDGHWYDNSSINFLQDFIKKAKAYPIFLLITSRYNDDGTKPMVFSEDTLKENDVAYLVIDLNILKKEAVKVFAEKKLNGKIDNELYELLLRTTNGNPFYIDQILEYFVESKLLKKENQTWLVKDKNIKVSGSINAILMARIDRLSHIVKETVKAAAVIGREFEIPVLSEVMKNNDEFIRANGNANAVLKEQIRTAEKGQIWKAMNELRYIFKHSLLRETVYDMQLKTRLRQLHLWIAVAIEKLYVDNLEEKYIDLVFHYEEAEAEEKSVFYLEKAADFARRNYQNQQALSFYEKLLKYLSPKDNLNKRIRTLLNTGSVYKLIGQWDKSQALYNQALDIISDSSDKSLSGRVNNSLGNLLLLKGDYQEAKMHLEAAATFFDWSNDEIGTSKAYGNLGNLFFRQGQYEEAKSYFTKSLNLKQSKPNAQIVATLGLTYMNQGNFDEGIRCQKEQLEICETMGDQQGMASLNTNLGIVYFEKGDYDNALSCYEKGLKLSNDLGNKQLKSIAVGCIGTVYQKKGDFAKAMELFEEDLVLTEELGDKQGIAIVNGLIGELYAVKGEFDLAKEFLHKNLSICEELNYQKGIAKTLNSLGDIHRYQKEFDQALAFYDRAIKLTRNINFRPVLCQTLIEKGFTNIQKGNHEEAHSIYLEAMEIAENLGNPNLIVQAVVLSAQVAHFTDLPEIADKTLTDLLAQTNTEEQKAYVHYELAKINVQKKNHAIKALDMYKKLYQQTPKYIYQQRISELSGKV